MRKKYLALAAVTAAMMLAVGCSDKAQETGAETVQAGEETQQGAEDSTGVEEPESIDRGEEELEDEAMPEGPLRVWGTITEVSEDSITANCESDTSNMGEVILMIDPDHTYVLDAASGLPVELKDVKTGDFEAYLGEAMTMSLPPQNTPYAVIVNIPEGTQAPQYVVASGAVDSLDAAGILTGIDETEYRLARSVSVEPFLTKNIVALEDIQSGSRCLVWMNDEGDVDRIVLFGE